MFQAARVILSVVIVCGLLIAAILESTHRGFFLCICAGFAIGAIAGELARAHRVQLVRSAPTTWSRARTGAYRRRQEWLESRVVWLERIAAGLVSG